MKKLLKKAGVKKIGWMPRVRSRHPTHDALRGTLPRMPFSSVIRFGSTTESDAQVELNSVESVHNSSSKLRMKRCFREDGVKTADWIESQNIAEIQTWATERFPIVGKQIFGSRGRGNTLIQNAAELTTYLASRATSLSSYIFEKYYNYVREYRLHVNADGCFYTCRKMIKEATPKEQRWFRNDSNCVWIIEDNELFDRPSNWEAIVAECVKALNSCGLDFGACDLRVQSSKVEGKVRKDPEFIVVEINSAPSFGEGTTTRYAEMIPALLTKKANK